MPFRNWPSWTRKLQRRLVSSGPVRWTGRGYGESRAVAQDGAGHLCRRSLYRAGLSSAIGRVELITKEAMSARNCSGHGPEQSMDDQIKNAQGDIGCGRYPLIVIARKRLFKRIFFPTVKEVVTNPAGGLHQRRRV